MKNYETLHCHTTASDGKLSYQEVLDSCENLGIKIVAFTDHDEIINEKFLSQLRKYKGPVKWISGIEISSGVPKELGDVSASSYHIVGLFVDPTNKDLKEYCRKAKAARIERMQKIVKNLTGLGFKITEEMCLNASKGETVARPHIVEALFSVPENIELMHKYRDEMAKAAEKDSKLMIAYKKMEETVQTKGDEKQYPYDLFLTEDAFIKGIYVEMTFRPDLDSNVALIRNAGGIAILAHYTYSKKRVGAEITEKLFKENRLDGGETVYGMEPEKGMIRETKEEFRADQKFIKSMVDKYNKVESGGVDAHILDDLKLFAKQKEYAQRTIGFTHAILQKKKLDTKWSNIKSADEL